MKHIADRCGAGRRGMFHCTAIAPALADDDIVLRGMGSFHVGGRVAEVDRQGGAHDRAPARRPA